MRIISLLPSATEILCALGLEDQVVGITHGCDYPAAIRNRPRITRTAIPDGSGREIDGRVRERHAAGLPLYELDETLLTALKPDLLVTQGLCDVCAVPDGLSRAVAARLPGSPRVVSLAPRRLNDVLADIRELGDITGTEMRARELVAHLRARIEAVESVAGRRVRPRVSFLEWVDPLFAAGHWTPELVSLAGGEEGHGQPGGRSRGLTWEEVLHWQPEVMVIACCGLSVDRTLDELAGSDLCSRIGALPCGRSGRVYVTDGHAYFSRSSPRLAESLELLAHLFHPDTFPAPLVPWTAVEVASRA
jgi:iron complex transport system substrate-binding protein